MSPLQLPPARTALDDIFISELMRPDCAPLVIHAGHYALFRAPDGIAVDCTGTPLISWEFAGFSEFCQHTWDSACRTIATIDTSRNVKIMVLVNDWQFITSDKMARRDSEGEAARMREQYYRSNPTLPQYHLQQLEKYGLSGQNILCQHPERWLFSESALRADLSTLVRDLMRDEKRSAETGIHKYFDHHGEPIIEVSDDEVGNVCLFYCGNTNCAGEVIALLASLYERGIRRFLNVFPIQCREPVGIGTRMAGKLFKLNDFTVINAAVGGPTNNGDPVHMMVDRYGPNW